MYYDIYQIFCILANEMLQKLKKQYSEIFPRLSLTESQKFHFDLTEENFRRSRLTTIFTFAIANIFLVGNYWLASLEARYFWSDVALWVISLGLMALGFSLKRLQANSLQKSIFTFVLGTFLMCWGANISIAELSLFGNFFTYFLSILGIASVFYLSSLSLLSMFLLSFLWLINTLALQEVKFDAQDLWINGFTSLTYLSFIWIISRILYSYRLHYFIVRQELEYSHQELQTEHQQQLKLSQELQQLTQVQEDRIRNRTKGLARANEALKSEIYERRQIEQALRQNKTKLEQQNQHLAKLNQELDNFVYRASHDLRAPLTSAMGLINLIEAQIDPDKQAYYIQLVKQSLQRVDFFIHDIVDYAQNTRYPLNIKAIDLVELSHLVLDRLRLHEQNSQSIDTIVDIKTKQIFYSDPMRLRLILNSLLSNAYTFSQPQVKSAFVKLSIYTQAKEELCIEVEDNGEGIAEADLPHIFDMFYRGSSRSQGSGLGLYILQDTLTRLGGSIELETKRGEGSKFIVKIPNGKSLNKPSN